MSKRYVLVKADGEGPKSCAFFASAAGCRNAAGCKFLHGGEPTAGSIAAKSQPPPPVTKPVPVPSPAASTQALAPKAAPLEQNPSASLLVSNGQAIAEAESAIKKEKKKAKKAKKEASKAAATAAAATAAAAAAAVAVMPPPVAATTVAAVVAPATVAPTATVVAAEEKILSPTPTKAKKQAFREKAARKAAATAAAAAAAPPTIASVAATPIIATSTTPAPAAAPTATILVAAVPAPLASTNAVQVAILAGAAPSKKKRRKNKKKAAVAAAAAAGGVLPSVPVSLPAASIAPTPTLPNGTTSSTLPPSAPPAVVFHPMPVMLTRTPPPNATGKGVCSFFNKKKGCKAGALCPFLHQGAEGGGLGGTRGHAKPQPTALPTVVTLLPTPPVAVAAPAAALGAKKPKTKRIAGLPSLEEQRAAIAASTAAASPPQQAAPDATYSSLSTASVPVAAPVRTIMPQKLIAAPVPVTAIPAATAVMPLPPPSPLSPAASPLSSLAPMSPSVTNGTATATATATLSTQKSRGARKRGRSETPATGPRDTTTAGSVGVGGLLDGLPISPFIMPGAGRHSAAVGIAAVAAAAVAIAPVKILHEKADPWQGLVERTRAHPKYEKSYGFEADSAWIKASPCGSSCAGLPQVVALDCEMVMSEDPVTKARNGKELVRLSIVNGEDGQPLLDTLVRPVDPVVEWRTDIHGVAPEHLESVAFTLSHAQDVMKRICCEHTVMIGHALNNDLAALKMTHSKIVDTSFLFEGQDKKFSTPSLKDVVKAALGKEIQDGSHDSVTDAQCTLDVARHALKNNNGAPIPVSRTKKKRRHLGLHRDGSKRRKVGGDGSDAAREREEKSLLVHRLPAGTTQLQVMRVMEKKTGVAAVEAEAVRFNGGTGKTQVMYPSKTYADLAFNAISTSAQEDASGRLQKKIYTSQDGKKYISVRHSLVMDDDAGPQGEGLASLLSSTESSSSSSSSEEE